jgi:hypothetical protein
MTTTPTNGVAIEAVVYPLNEGTATRMTVLVLNFLIAEMPGKFAIALLNVLNEAANSNSADANDDSVQSD